MMPDKRFAAGWALIEELQKSPFRWHVRFIVATDSGLRVRHEECCINAPDQFAAVAVAMITTLDHVTAERWEGVNILVDAMPNTDYQPREEPLTEEQIIERGEAKKNPK